VALTPRVNGVGTNPGALCDLGDADQLGAGFKRGETGPTHAAEQFSIFLGVDCQFEPRPCRKFFGLGVPPPMTHGDRRPSIGIGREQDQRPYPIDNQKCRQQSHEATVTAATK
jgi:hypothetical protein